MKFDTPLTVGTFIKRYKRFFADVRLVDGTVVTAHVPNTGSMMSTSAPGSPVAISHHPRENRKLKWTLELFGVDGCWVGVNTMRPNRIVEEAIALGQIESLRGYPAIKREVKYGASSRVDLLLKDNDNRRCYVEVKNVTYRHGDQALFPDAVTARGTKHLRELADMVKEGHRAVIFYLVNRSDCAGMALAQDIDPTYAQTFDQAILNGVEALCYCVQNDLTKSVVDKKIELSR